MKIVWKKYEKGYASVHRDSGFLKINEMLTLFLNTHTAFLIVNLIEFQPNKIGKVDRKSTAPVRCKPTGCRLFSQNLQHQHTCKHSSVEICNLFSCLRYFFISRYDEAKRGLFTPSEGKHTITSKISRRQCFSQNLYT